MHHIISFTFRSLSKAELRTSVKQIFTYRSALKPVHIGIFQDAIAFRVDDIFLRFILLLHFAFSQQFWLKNVLHNSF